jgi:hypothetical protein
VIGSTSVATAEPPDDVDDDESATEAVPQPDAPPESEFAGLASRERLGTAVATRPGYDRRQFEALFGIIADTVFAEIRRESQPVFAPIRRIIGLFRSAAVLATKLGGNRTAISVLEHALHSYDVANRAEL